MALQIRIGSRASKLALWQSENVRQLLIRAVPDLSVEISEIVTRGDQDRTTPLPAIGGKGLFTLELEEAIRDNKIDIAVHSLKDLPTEMAAGLTLGAICARASAFDCLISRNKLTLSELPHGALVGTSSLRRQAQLMRLRPDLKIQPLRGNVDSRIKKVLDSDAQLDAAILAEAGLERLGLNQVITERFNPQMIVPAPGQGALAVQCRNDRTEIIEILQHIHCADTQACVSAERSLLATLEAGCSAPLGALATIIDGKLTLSARVYSADFNNCYEGVKTCQYIDVESSLNLGKELAREIIDGGFKVV